MLPVQYIFSQIKIGNKNGECDGIYWLDKYSDHANPDSIRVVGSLKTVYSEVLTAPNGYIKINDKRYYADTSGNVDFKIKPGKYSVYAENIYSYGISTNIIEFVSGTAYQFFSYLKPLPPFADRVIDFPSEPAKPVKKLSSRAHDINKLN